MATTEFRNCEAQVSRFENIHAYVHQQERHFPLPERKYPADFKAKNDAASKGSDVLERKDVVVAKLHMEDGLTAHPWSQQMTRVLMPPVLEFSPVLERASGQGADHKFDCILAK